MFRMLWRRLLRRLRPHDDTSLAQLEADLRARRTRLREQMAPLLWFADQPGPLQEQQRGVLERARQSLDVLARHADAVAELRRRLAQTRALADAQEGLAAATAALAAADDLPAVQAARDALVQREVERELDAWLSMRPERPSLRG